MEFVTESITLDVHSVLSQVSIPAPQNDTARRIRATLTEGGKAYYIPDGCRAVFTGTKADGTILLNDCIIENNTVIRYDFTEQTTSAVGRVDVTIKLYGEDGGILTTPRLTLVVYEGTGADITISADEKNAIDALFLAENSRVAAEGSRVKAEAARVAAETARDGAEKTRSTAEQGRAHAESLRGTAEQERVVAEGARVLAEEARVKTESARVTAEEARSEAEKARASAEDSRAQAEKARVAAESGRVTAENTRETNETARESLRADLERLKEALEELIATLPTDAVELIELVNRVNAILDSDDETLDELSEIVAYIKSNKPLIDAITTSKVSVTDIVNNLATNVTNKPLSAAQGVVLKGLVDNAQATADANRSASTITAGTFAGQVVANGSGQTPGTSLLRNSKLVTADTNPTVNGEICWTYE